MSKYYNNNNDERTKFDEYTLQNKLAHHIRENPTKSFSNIEKTLQTVQL